MKRIQFLLFALLSLTISSNAQFRLGLFGGLSNYQGDLTDKPYRSSRAAVGVTGTFPLSQRFNIRVSLTFAGVAGADSLAGQPELRARNLSFQSRITELAVVGEYNFFNLDQIRWSPYVFAGLALFHFDPYTYTSAGTKTYLQPLTTEGQGIDGYPGTQYALNQVAIPFGGGLRYAISSRVHFALELGVRKLFTDYLDDVGGDYADPNDLLVARGQTAVDLAYRGDEVPGGTAGFPGKGMTMGSAKSKDYYYFTGLHLTFALGEPRDRSGLGCPKVNF